MPFPNFLASFEAVPADLHGGANPLVFAGDYRFRQWRALNEASLRAGGEFFPIYRVWRPSVASRFLDH